jgi:hypothetical protein
MKNKLFAPQRGQALSEFLVLAFALIPLFLLMPVIAKYQDISHATQMASRYVAYDATTNNGFEGSWKPEAQLADEVRRRFFSNVEAPVKTNDSAGNFLAHQNLFWRDPKGASLVPDLGNSVQVSYGSGNGTTHAEGLGSRTQDTFLFEGLRNMMSLPDNNRVYTGNVAVTLANLPAGIKSYEPFDKINLSMTRSTSLVVDPWMSNSPRQAENRFGKLAPINQALATIEPVVELLIFGAGPALPGSSLPLLPGLELGEFHGPRFGRLDTWRDVIPADRLK